MQGQCGPRRGAGRVGGREELRKGPSIRHTIPRGSYVGDTYFPYQCEWTLAQCLKRVVGRVRRQLRPRLRQTAARRLNRLDLKKP